MTKTSDSAWDDILMQDEQILWQGGPSTRVRLRGAEIPTLLIGVFFVVIASFFIVNMFGSVGNLIRTMPFGLIPFIHLTVGLGLVLYPFVISPFLRRHTFYTLTNRRAIIARDLPIQGRSLKSYGITPATQIEAEASHPGSVYFATGFTRLLRDSQSKKIGFEMIPDPKNVYSLMSKIQRGEL